MLRRTEGSWSAIGAEAQEWKCKRSSNWMGVLTIVPVGWPRLRVIFTEAPILRRSLIEFIPSPPCLAPVQRALKLNYAAWYEELCGRGEMEGGEG